MWDYRVEVECMCNEQALISAFNLLNIALNKRNDLSNGVIDNLPFEFRILVNSHEGYRKLISESKSELSDLECKDYYVSLPSETLNRTQIVLTIKIESDDDVDIFTYRYFFLIVNQLLRKDDIVYFECPETYYHKVGSYFFLQTLSKHSVTIKQRMPDGTAKRLPQRFSLSSEWLPSIYLPSSSSDVYEVLANPLFQDVESLKGALGVCSQQAGRLSFEEDVLESPKTTRELYTYCLKQYFTGWLNDFNEILSAVEIEDRLYSTSGISQLLFAMLFKKMWNSGSPYSRNEIERLLEVCCDFGDCILQVAENIISHTNGGVLSVRINDNWEKIKNTFQKKGEEKTRWYMRISLVDFSENGILDNVQEKSRIGDLTLSHIFMDREVPAYSKKENFEKTAIAYDRYLNRSEQIIHHYGLSVFRNVVNQYGGCFTVKSGSKAVVTDRDWYSLDSNSISCNSAVRNTTHIPGTEYDILIPVNQQLLKNQERPNSLSILLKPKYIVPSVSRNIVFKEGFSEYFNTPLSNVVRRTIKDTSLGYQQKKEKVVKDAASEVADRLRMFSNNEINRYVFYFYLSDISGRVFGRTEIVAKIILQVIAGLKANAALQDNENEFLYIVLYGLSKSQLAQFTRQFALFYHRSEGNRLMAGCQLYVVSYDYKEEVLFSGEKLSVIADYCRSRRLVAGTSSEILGILSHIASREVVPNECKEEINAFPFDLLPRMEVVEPNSRPILSKHNKWYHKNLETVLRNDIHGEDLGCCLQDVHVRVGGVHLNTFYEGQLLFANLYWYQIFAHYICETILADKRIDADSDILLYGYETYSEQMLFAAAQKLRDKGRKVYYAVFENPKYITVAELSEQRVRYIEGVMESPIKRLCVVYLYGIGTTLTTIGKKMNAQLEQVFFEQNKNELLNQAYKKGIVIVQITDKVHLECDQKNHTVSSPSGNLEFLTDKVCNYLIELQTTWYSAEDCVYCLQSKSYLEERPLIQTNETSTVPMILIKPNKPSKLQLKYKQTGNYTQAFLQNQDSAEYLYYSHLNRSGNHYQFYIRTAALLNDYLRSENPQLTAWFREIREKELGNIQNRMAAQINIIVSPQHFSNESLVAAVNDQVFGGAAYIINFDVKKEFRDSFVAKFQNYRSAMEQLCRDSKVANLDLNFYFVDDIILTGSTINRAKSLISSMLGKFAGVVKESFALSVNLFKGIILLVNRNSKQTMCNYFWQPNLEKDLDESLILPVYAFIQLNTPAIRSYGDSCPICNKVVRIQTLARESALTYVERHWQEKEKYHKLKKLSDAKIDKVQNNNLYSGDEFYKTRGLRRLQCSEVLWALLKERSEKRKITKENAHDIICEEINGRLHQKQSEAEKIEYLISYLIIISREHIVFQEVVQPVAFRILLSILSIFIEDNKTPDSPLYDTVRSLIQSNTCPSLICDLYRITIARLCAMGSTVFCRKNQLKAILATGLALERNIGALGWQREEPFPEFLCIQIKKMLFVTKDCAFRVTKLQQILEACIRDELKESRKIEYTYLSFFASMYLESICNETRTVFLKRWRKSENKVEDFHRRIETEEYNDLLNSFRKLMGAQKAVMFQTRTQEDLTEETEDRSITLLASAQGDGERVDILRSELLDFYCNHNLNSERPCSQELLSIKDTVRIVSVGEKQKDKAVQSYTRQACTIAYVRLDYTDRLQGGMTGHLYFAFFYPPQQSQDLMGVLKQLQGFLSFRQALKQRIEKDFSGNLFGQRTEETWRIDWLSIEKAGAHTDSSGVTRLISQHFSRDDGNILGILFDPDQKSTPQDQSQFLKLTYNVLIAMYFRAVISDRQGQFKSADNLQGEGKELHDEDENQYYKVEDLIRFSETDFPSFKLRFGHGQTAEDINGARLYGAKSTLKSADGKLDLSGMPVYKYISFPGKYLRAFLVDILCNIEKYGAKESFAEMYIESGSGSPRYLVFKNQVDVAQSNTNLHIWCLKENYKLKQSIEFDATGSSIPKGFSLACTAHCMRLAGDLKACYSYDEEAQKTYFTIKLPMLQ